jgi:RNA polymerase sigma-70 factor (ECF subfamily)
MESMNSIASQNNVAPCLLSTWEMVENSLYQWLYKQSNDEALALDILQETFLRGLQRDNSFCDIENQKAWLFRVASNLLTDEWRKQSRLESLEVMDYANLIHPLNMDDPVVGLVQCLPKALACLTAEEREVIERCDLQGIKQQDFAASAGLSLPAVKSRVQRARTKLKQHLNTNCSIRFDEFNRVCCFFPPQVNRKSQS